MSDQPDALRLADDLEIHAHHAMNGEAFSAAIKAAAELRRLHAELEGLKADIENHVRIAAELATENEQLRSALAEATLQHDTAQSTEGHHDNDCHSSGICQRTGFGIMAEHIQQLVTDLQEQNALLDAEAERDDAVSCGRS